MQLEYATKPISFMTAYFTVLKLEQSYHNLKYVYDHIGDNVSWSGDIFSFIFLSDLLEKKQQQKTRLWRIYKAFL